ncbi:MAG: IPT/TIG domain-containing protein [Candidatus Methanoperedens sp.]
MTAGVATDVTLTGSNFVEAPYTTTVLVDGAAATQKSLTDTQIVVTVNLAVGGHSVQVEKGGVTSTLTTVIAIAPGTIASAQLADGVLTIDGIGLGAGQSAVAITKADGRTVFSDSITSSTETQTVAAASLAAVGDTVKVETPTGESTATIVAGVTATPTPVPTPTPTPTPTPGPSITSATLKNGVLTIAGSGFETKPSKNPQNNIWIVISGKTYYAKSIKSWSLTTIVANVPTNFKVNQMVTVKTASGKTATAKIS